ncbi:MAG: LuxR C-terminal-related transcriptional regulator [Arenicellales bacterium]|nr:LuxR C-terminal-related transcriptional regulator [Arenicellales bacterium]
MSTKRQAVPIIRNKFYRPSVTIDYISRDALSARLEAGVDLPLTIVSAPAGYGKSTLVSHWLGIRGSPSVWLSLDESDSDPRVFLTYFIAALRTVSPEICEGTLDIVNAESLPPLPVIAAHLSNDLDELDERVVLALDDYHRIQDPDIHLIIDCLLEHPSQHLHLIILSRRDPILSLTSLRARHLLTEIRMDDLRFSVEETLSFLRQATTQSIPLSALNRLHDSTEGWPVGIRLAALALQHQHDVEAFLTHFGADSRPLREYLLGEVLSGQSPVVRACLLSTSILSRFNASLCEEVLGSDVGDKDNPVRGEDFIKILEDSGLFCITLDEQHEWFRYHHLFGDLLKQQLEQSQSKEQISKLHLRASNWFAENGYFEEAIQHALIGGDENAAARIVGEVRHDLMNRDHWHRLERWLKLFSEDTVEKHPQLLVLRCWLEGLYRYRLDLLVRDLGLADALLEDLSTKEADQMKAELAALRSGLAYWTLKLTDSVALAEQSLTITPAENECVRSTALLMQGAAHQAIGELDKSESLLMESMEAGGFSEPSSHARLLQSLCFVYWPEADTHKLRRTATRLLEISLEHKQTWSLSFARYFLGLNHYERNELDQAVVQLEPIVDEPYRYPIQNVTHCSFVLSLSYLAQGLWDRAREVAESIEKLTFERGNKMFISLAEAFRAELDLRQGLITQAAQWLTTYALPPPHIMHRFFNVEFTALKVLMPQETSDSRKEVTEQLNSLHQLLRQSHHRRLMIDILGMKALMAARDGDTESAISLLKESVLLGQPGQLTRPLADLGPEVGKLLSRLDLDREGSRYVGLIFSALREPMETDNVSVESQPLTEPLSQRELEILNLLAQNLTNKEIANKLFISIGTVKQHTHNIYSKLSASNRHDAVSKARNLAILKSG